MTMRFRTRAFLICFIPFALLLTASFWMIQRVVQSTVRDGLRASLRANELAIGRMHSKSGLQNSRFLKVAGENVSLKAGVQLLLSQPGNEEAQRTVEDQLRELGEHMGFDFLLVSAPDGTPLVSVVRSSDPKTSSESQLVPVATRLLKPDANDLLLIDGRPFQIGSVPMDENNENIASLTVGEYFDFSEFTTPAVFIHDGKAIKSNLPNVSLEELNAALAKCAGQTECELRLHGANWLSIPLQGISSDGKNVLRSLENVDAAIYPLQATLRRLFLTVALISVLIAFLCSVASSRSIVQPIAAIVAHLRTVRTGVLPEFENLPSPILEVRQLADSYNWAAGSVRRAQESLQRAYIEFVGSLAHALEKRDPYTAGHSHRVSELSCVLASAMKLDEDHIAQIRIGALLHDIGKIGVPDSILQKAGRLTYEEFSIVKEHPSIGRHILEGVQGFAPFLPAVELHHENWDGTGYPKGQVGEETPIDARIIHVADAYDAMTSSRSYRNGMTYKKAVSILCENAGTQFDPRIVDLLVSLPLDVVTGQPAPLQEAAKAEEFEFAETQ